jgi:uncharacterized protein involved in exopolysaccharide biosynthesis
MSAVSDNWMDGDGRVDVRAVVARLWRRRSWLLISAILFSAVFAAAAFLMTPVYRATTVLVPAGSSADGLGSLSGGLGQLGGLASLAGLAVGPGDTKTEEALAVMRSRQFTEAFISDLGLMPELFPERWDAEQNQWQGDSRDWPTLADGFDVFNEEIRTIEQDSQTGLVTVEILWRDPLKSAEWANELVTRLNNEMRARAISTTNAFVSYLEKELAATSTIETRQAIARLMESQINQRMMANVTQEYAFRVADRALPPDPKDVVRPNKPLLLLLGPLLGVLFAGMTALMIPSSANRG